MELYHERAVVRKKAAVNQGAEPARALQSRELVTTATAYPSASSADERLETDNRWSFAGSRGRLEDLKESALDSFKRLQGLAAMLQFPELILGDSAKVSSLTAMSWKRSCSPTTDPFRSFKETPMPLTMLIESTA